MAAKNDITGDSIKSKALSKQGQENWDRIYAKKSGLEWLKGEIVELLDPDGWRLDDGVTLETPITYEEFSRRIPYCTVMYKGDSK